METPTYGQRIYNINDFQAQVQKLTHVAVRRKRYFHHYLVLDLFDGGVTIIHYTPTIEALKSFRIVKVIKENLQYSQNDTDLFDFDSGLYFIKRTGYPLNENEERIANERASSRYNETRYISSSNNCEHLVTWILTGESTCEQLQDTCTRFNADVLEAVTRIENTLFPFEICSVASFHSMTKSGQVLANIVKAAKEAAKAGTVMAEQTVNVIKTSVPNVSRAGASAITSGIACGISAAIAAPIEFGAAALSIYGLYQQKKQGHLNSKQFYRETTKTITGSISSVGLSALGGFIGGFVGSFLFPGVGTVLGGMLGGLLGGLLGRFCGSIAGGKAYDAIRGK